MELELSEGWVEAELAGDFPELALVHTQLEVQPRRSPREVRSGCASSPTATPAPR